MKLKNLIFLTVGLICIFSSALAMTGEGHISQEKTPGQKMSEKQSELLTKENFANAFGGEALIEANKKDVDFDIFHNIELDFDAPQKRNNLRVIKKIANKYNDISENSSQVYLRILKLDDEIKYVNIARIKEIAVSYFSYHFKVDKSQITFDDKVIGDQLGLIAEIQTEKGKIKYYIKTHSGGLQSQHSSGAKTLNARELAVYKILEYLGIGCETHFFGRDLKNFYIATKDAKSTEYGHDFDTYGNFLKNIKIELKEIPRGIEEGLTALDLISRIMRLSDLQTNSGNFGFSSTAHNYIVRAIDFRVGDDDISYEVNEDHYRGLLEGNGPYSYTGDNLISYVLKEQEEPLRIERAKIVFKAMLSNYKEVLDKTYQEVSKALESTTSEDSSNLENLKKALDSYLKDVHHNFEFFQEKLNKPMEKILT